MVALKMFECFFFFLISVFALIVHVHAQDQSGFISVACGAPSDYTDSKTGINYTTDASFVSTGIPSSVSAEYRVDDRPQLLWNLRSFPNGTRNCYNVKLKKGNPYIVRAIFSYGNYDGKSQAPQFEIFLGANLWDSINLVNESQIITKELVHTPSSNLIYFCLVNTGYGTPLISGLEFRIWKYRTVDSESSSRDLFARWDVASATNEDVRFKDDVYDRIWLPYHFPKSLELSTDHTIESTYEQASQVPVIVMQTAATMENANDPLEFTVKVDDNSQNFYVNLYFAELVVLEPNETRSFNISLNGVHASGPVVPKYLTATAVYIPSTHSEDSYMLSIYKTETSTLPPLINAIEIYTDKKFPQAETLQQDVDVVLNIKSKYKLLNDWQGDPCSPQNLAWTGLNCSYNEYNPPRITSLKLSSTGLKGEFPGFISNLTMLQVLDLSCNNLTGSVPDFLAYLSDLQVLNLNGNKFSGTVPEKLLERSRDGSLRLSMSNSCSKKNSVLVPVIASVASVFVLLIAGVFIFLVLKRRKKQAWNRNILEMKRNKPNPMLETKNSNRRFTYAEILTITNNFETVIGVGGFGKVYLGYTDDKQVAVKVLSVTSRQGYSQFQAEVNLLTRVHHRHLTTLVGYCDEDNKIGLIYEYMANADLSKHLSERATSVLSWEERLKIAVDAAQGLEYLHDGCKPPIVHRDIKTTNILLNDKFQAKLSDFGLSKSFPIEGATHVSTIVAGTLGYLEPEYHKTGRLTEKSDVYSFGVVLLEIITCRPVISLSNTEENEHINQWVNYMLSGGDIHKIVDKRLFGDFDTNSAWKCLEIAMDCVSASPTRRPTMDHVVMELKECLAMEISRRETLQESFDMFTDIEHTGMTPLAR